MVNLINTLILGIELPSTVVTAINRKIEQYYISEEYKFRVAREIRESERKRIEAEGISEFQQIVSQGISDSYLRWRGIEATLQLAQSSNSKIVILGSGKDGLPTILGTSMDRNRRNQRPRLETEKLRPRRRQVRLRRHLWSKRQLIPCRSHQKRRQLLSRALRLRVGLASSAS
jgi:hypothetical protein